MPTLWRPQNLQWSSVRIVVHRQTLLQATVMPSTVQVLGFRLMSDREDTKALPKCTCTALARRRCKRHMLCVRLGFRLNGDTALAECTGSMQCGKAGWHAEDAEDTLITMKSYYEYNYNATITLYLCIKMQRVIVSI